MQPYQTCSRQIDVREFQNKKAIPFSVLMITHCLYYQVH